MTTDSEAPPFVPSKTSAPPLNPTTNSGCRVEIPISRTASESPADLLAEQEPESVDVAQVLKDSASLAAYFEEGLENDGRNGAEDEDDDEEAEREDDGVDGDEGQGVDNPEARKIFAFADKFILETRRKGGRQTENSVLKQWKVCKNYSSHSMSNANLKVPLDMGFGSPGFQGYP